MAKVTEQMTAVEWLIQQEFSNDYFSNETINKAKQMEKEQIMGAFKKGETQGIKGMNNAHYSSLITAEDYYNQTYKTQAQ